MSLKRRVKRSIARATGIERSLQRRVDALEAKHRSAVEGLHGELASERARAERAEYLYRTNRRLASAYAETFTRMPRYEYGSLVPGNADWSEKWRTTKGLRILMFANRDYAGSFYKWTLAINTYTNHAARLVVTVPHEYGYELDLLLPNPGLVASDWSLLWKEADILHLKDEIGFFRGPNLLPIEMLSTFQGPRIFTQYGGYARRQQSESSYQNFVGTFDRVVSMTPDLCFEWLGPQPIYIPHSIDTDGLGFCWTSKPNIGHSPSTRSRKGTEEFLEAIDLIRADHDIELDLIEGVSHAEVMRRKQGLGLFFDQAGREVKESLGIDSVIGWYGNSAIEAGVFGVPTIAHLSERAFAGAERAGIEGIREIPIINTPLGTEGLRRTILSFLDMSDDERADVASRTRRFIKEFHSHRAVADRLSHLYQGLV